MIVELRVGLSEVVLRIRIHDHGLVHLHLTLCGAYPKSEFNRDVGAVERHPQGHVFSSECGLLVSSQDRVHLQLALGGFLLQIALDLAEDGSHQAKEEEEEDEDQIQAPPDLVH